MLRATESSNPEECRTWNERELTNLEIGYWEKL